MYSTKSYFVLLTYDVFVFFLIPLSYEWNPIWSSAFWPLDYSGTPTMTQLNWWTVLAFLTWWKSSTHLTLWTDLTGSALFTGWTQCLNWWTFLKCLSLRYLINRFNMIKRFHMINRFNMMNRFNMIKRFNMMNRINTSYLKNTFNTSYLMNRFNVLPDEYLKHVLSDESVPPDEQVYLLMRWSCSSVPRICSRVEIWTRGQFKSVLNVSKFIFIAIFMVQFYQVEQFIQKIETIFVGNEHTLNDRPRHQFTIYCIQLLRR